MGYITYIVNQTGKDIYAFINTGENGTGFDTRYLVPAGHNCGPGRAGLCISQFGISFDPGATQPNLATWPNGQNIDGCLSWGFVIGPNGSLLKAEAWAAGQTGMPGEYPPSKTGCP